MRQAWKLSFLLLTRPRQGVRAVLAEPPTLKSLLLFLGVVGFLRGFLEALWLLGMQYQPGMWTVLLQEPSRYFWEGGLFITANVMTAYLRWAMYAFLFAALMRWFGVRVSFKHLSALAGLIMGLYVVPVLINTLYLVLPLPILKFSVSSVYQPIVGLGTLVTAFWFFAVALKIFHVFCGLKRKEAVLAALFIPLLDRVFFVGSAAVLFQLKQLAWLPVTPRMSFVTVGFIVVALAVSPLLLWFGRCLNQNPLSPPGERVRVRGEDVSP